MLKKTFIWAAITALFYSNVACAEESKVIDLTKEDLSNLIRTDENVVISFYQNDCEECEEISPIFEDAAAKNKGNVKFAKFNCANAETFCATYGAFEMPKIRAFKNGSPSKLYNVDEASVTSLLEFAERQILPSALEIDSKEKLNELTEGDELTAVAYISPDDKETIKKWQSMADMLSMLYNFGYITDAKLAEEQSVTEFPSLAIYKPFDEKLELTSGLPKNEVELNKKMALNSMPILGAIGEVEITPYYMTGLPFVFLFYKGDDMRESNDIIARPLAEKYKGKLHFVHADAKKYAGQAKELNLRKNKFPAVAAHNLNTDEKYNIDQSKVISAEELEAFVQDILKTEEASSMKKRDESIMESENVRQITKDEFDSVVLDPTKDVLLEVYSPECGHCQQFAPTWAQLNDILKESKAGEHGVIAVRMDGTKEMLPPSAGFQLEGFPTVKLYKAEKNEAGFKKMVSYEGDRTIQDLIQFLNMETSKRTFRIELAYPETSTHDEL